MSATDKSKADQPGTSEKQEWKRALAIALLVALVTSGANYLVQARLASSGVDEQYHQRRLDLIDRVASKCVKYRYLRGFKVRLGVAGYKAGAVVAGASTSDAVDKLPAEKRMAIQMKLKDDFPFEYGKMMECDDLRPDVDATLVVSRAYFGPKIENEIAKLQEVIDAEGLRKQIAARTPKNGNITNVNDVEVVEEFSEQMNAAMSALLSRMLVVVSEANPRVK
jgi:hypothetical protein